MSSNDMCATVATFAFVRRKKKEVVLEESSQARYKNQNKNVHLLETCFQILIVLALLQRECLVGACIHVTRFLICDVVAAWNAAISGGTAASAAHQFHPLWCLLLLCYRLWLLLWHLLLRLWWLQLLLGISQWRIRWHYVLCSFQGGHIFCVCWLLLGSFVVVNDIRMLLLLRNCILFWQKKIMRNTFELVLVIILFVCLFYRPLIITLRLGRCSRAEIDQFEVINIYGGIITLLLQWFFVVANKFNFIFYVQNITHFNVADILTPRLDDSELF